MAFHRAKEAEFHDQSASSLVPASNGAVEHVAIPNGVLETDGVRSQETDCKMGPITESHCFVLIFVRSRRR